MKSSIKTWIMISIFIIAMSYNVGDAAAYGWGYSKEKNNKAPNVSKYAEMLKRYRAFYMDDTNEKTLYLTFDNGYEMGFTEPILDVLKRENVPATFFVNGYYVEEHPELIKRMVNDWHIIGNHAYNHDDFSTLSKDKIKKELGDLEKAVARVSDQKTTTYMRPPSGTFDQKTIEWIDKMGYVQIFWSLAFKDWERNKSQGWKYAYNQIMDQVHPGAIIFFAQCDKG